MKKILLILLCFISFILPAFADYYPIPANKQAEYKAEIESIIDKEYPKIIKYINSNTKEATYLYNQILKFGYFSNNQMDVINLRLIYEVSLPSSELELYEKLVKITKIKYLGLKSKSIGTDCTESYADFMKPYFINNRINTDKLNNITYYEALQSKKIKKYIDNSEKLRPSTF